MMETHEIDPQSDPRWTTFVARSPNATVFHTKQWMAVLEQTYGFKLGVIAAVGKDSVVRGGIPYCEARSPIAGTRIVTLPFSDYCSPLVEPGVELHPLLSALRRVSARTGARALEIRGGDQGETFASAGFSCTSQWLGHVIDLQAGLSAVEAGYHADCVRRKIRKAERSGVEVIRATAKSAMKVFYPLMVLTRRRHGYPPPPRRWFQNIADTMPNAEVLMAYYHGVAVAGLVTLTFNKTVYYKYGASSERFHALGAMPLLYATMVRGAVEVGATSVDLGRTDVCNRGLALFKERFGATRVTLKYWGDERAPWLYKQIAAGITRSARAVTAQMPLWALPKLGEWLYPHIS